MIPTDNPYVAISNVGISEEDTLTIEPGVILRFEEDKEFIVQGYLNSVGTPTDSILFTSNKEFPKPDDWKGISFYGSKPNILKYTRIEFSNLGINYSIEYETPNNEVDKCLIWKNVRGISVERGHILIKESKILNNQSDGIIIKFFGSSTIDNTSICNNLGTGINFYSYIRLILSNSIVKNNTRGGISLSGGESNKIFIKDNLIIENQDFGISLSTTHIVDIINNLIIENKTGVAIRERPLYDFDGNIINNCLIQNNIGIDLHITGTPGWGGFSWGPIMHNIFYMDSVAIKFDMLLDNPNVLYNDFFENTLNFSGYVHDSLGVLVTANTNSDRCDKYYNIFSDPLFVNPNDGDYHLSYIEKGFPQNSPCRDAGNSNVFYNDAIDGTVNDMGAYGGGYLIPSFLSYDFGSLAVNFSKTKKLEIKNNRSESFTIENLSLSDSVNFSIKNISKKDLQPFSKSEITIEFHPLTIGDFLNDLIIESDNFYGAKFAEITLQGKSLQGTFINEEYVIGKWSKSKSPYIVYSNRIKIPEGDSLIIEPGVQVIFSADASSEYFTVNGKLIAEGTENNPILFSEINRQTESWEGLVFSVSSFVSLKYCIIEYAWHGVTIGSSNVILDNCIIRNCGSEGGEGGAMRVTGGWPPSRPTKPLIKNCTISNNHAKRGGGIWCRNAAPLIINNIIAKNHAKVGGAIYYDYGYKNHKEAPFIINNTITDNGASSYCGGIYVGDTLHVFENNIVWDNVAPSDSQIYISPPWGAINISYSNIQGGWGGDSNIDLDPLFVAPYNNDYQLLQNSLCIDAGNPDPKYNDIEDPNKLGYALYPSLGTIRNDMGAYGGPGAANWDIMTAVEFKPEKQVNFPRRYELFQNYPNPFNPTTTMKYQLPKSSEISLKIYNILGQLMKTLVDEKQIAGNHSIGWDGKDNLGRLVSSGLYFYTLRTKDYVKSHKMVLIR